MKQVLYWDKEAGNHASGEAGSALQLERFRERKWLTCMIESPMYKRKYDAGGH